MTATRRALLAAPALLALPAQAALDLGLPEQVAQGALVVGRGPPLLRIAFNGRPLRVSPEGHFAFGFGRDAPNVAVLDIRPPTGTPETRRITVLPRTYEEQRIDNLPPAMVTPAPDTLERIRREQVLINAARAHDTAAAHFAAGFAWPVTGRITGVFGSRRILNGEARAPHLGIDIAAPTGTPTRAGCAGIVRLAEPDLYFNGGAVIIDHGHTVMSMSSHLSRLDVRVGERVEAETVIGLVGATGRVTGPHLDWRVFWAGTALDPMLILPARG